MLMMAHWAGSALLILAVTVSLGCAGEKGPPELPAADAAASRYGEGVDAELRGNLLEVRIAMSEELLRGGEIWARGGPYFYLFSSATRDLFVEHPDLAAVRAVTLDAQGNEIARATLLRDRLSEFRWREALAIGALAQQEGTERPRRIEQLIDLGEELTEYSYNFEAATR
jgi:predicted small lipoprotein YifL